MKYIANWDNISDLGKTYMVVTIQLSKQLFNRRLQHMRENFHTNFYGTSAASLGFSTCMSPECQRSQEDQEVAACVISVIC